MKATIPDWDLYSWESQARQLPKKGKPGITYRRYCCCAREQCIKGIEACGRFPVDSLTYRNRKGDLVGILYLYRADTSLEKVGNINIWVRPDRQRRGIGTALVDEADRRWGPLNFEQQRYTAAGLAFVEKRLAKAQGLVAR